MPRSPILATVAAALAAVLVATPGAPAATPQPPDCRLLVKLQEKEHALPQTALVARDPSGGLLSRTRSFTFGVRGPRAALGGLSRVEWALDGVTKHVDDRGPSFQWSGGFAGAQSIPAGDHTLKVTAVPKTGSPASVEFPLAATDCPFVEFQAFPARGPGKGATELSWDSAFQSDSGPPLTAVAARVERNIASALPAGVRGQTVGTLTVERPGKAAIKRRMRAPRNGGVLVREGALAVTLHPGVKEFLTVTGLPAGTQSVRVVLRGPGARLAHAQDPCRKALVRGILRAGTATASEVQGGSYAC